MVAIPALIQTEGKRWSGVVMTPSKAATFALVAKRLTAPAAKARYLAVQAKTGVPWFAIAVIHERECSQNWNGGLAQGDPWNKKSVHVPAGRGPFASWEDAAYDALVNCAPKAARWTDWSAGGLLTVLEEYNGLGYATRGVPSPYIWAGTNEYKSGKYVRDGVYDPLAVDSQLGCAGLLIAMMQIDSTIKVGVMTTVAAPAPTARISSAKPAIPVVASPSIVPTSPSVTNPTPGSIGATLASVFSHLFSHL